MHDSVQLQYHRLMRAATAEEAALLHSHNDSIRFLSWLFALMKVRRLNVSAIPTVVAVNHCASTAQRQAALAAMLVCALVLSSWATPWRLL